MASTELIFVAKQQKDYHSLAHQMKQEENLSEIKEADVTKAIDSIKNSSLDESTKGLVLGVLTTFGYLLAVIQKKNTTISKLRRWIFKRTESAKNLFGNKSKNTDSTNEESKNKGPESSKNEPKPNPEANPESKPKAKPKAKKKGHGRNPNEAYTVQAEVHCAHENLVPGAICPVCNEGKVYPVEPSKFIQLVAQPLLNVTRYTLDKLRCNLCLNIFEAKLPEGVQPNKYDPTVGVTMAINRYGLGLPSYRMESILNCQGIPFSDSQMFVLQEEVARGIDPIYNLLTQESSNSTHLNIDDTTARVQALTILNKTKTDKERKGVFTSVVNSTVDSHPVSLFFTGIKHAGEALEDILKNRSSSLPFFVMGDASTKNRTDHPLATEVNCNSHSRRQFADIIDAYPETTEWVIESYKELYKNEANCKLNKLSSSERLALHKRLSLPIMELMKNTLSSKIETKQCEPNSLLGKAISYFIKHYDKLIGFCMYEGVPLDNNQCERTIKKFILTRKNSLQYKTLHGAWVGERLMTLIHTAIENKINPFKYLEAIMRNLQKVELNPQKWYPWNYHLNFSLAG